MPAEPLSCQHVSHTIKALFVPEPSKRAVPDSLLYSLPAAPMAGAIAGGDMVAL